MRDGILAAEVEGRYCDPAQSKELIARLRRSKDEFDQLYEEGATKRRMMVVSLHDRISGHANRVRVLDRFLAYAKSKPGVRFARKDEVAKWALEHRAITPVYDRGAPTVSGLPGSAAYSTREERRHGAQTRRAPSRHANHGPRLTALALGLADGIRDPCRTNPLASF